MSSGSFDKCHDPADATHKGASWIKNLEEYQRGLDTGEDMLQKFSGLKLALRRRAKGVTGGAGWDSTVRALFDWHIANRIGEIYTEEAGQVYTAVETLSPEALSDFCESYGATEGHAEYPSRKQLLAFLQDAENAVIAVELESMPQLPAVPPPNPFVVVLPSHPQGMGPVAPLQGRHRVHFPLMPRQALQPSRLSQEALAMMGVSLLWIGELDSSNPALPGWRGLTVAGKDVMVSALVAGCTDKIRPGQAISLEVVETVSPYRVVQMPQVEWDAIPHVGSHEEAWQMYITNKGVLSWFSLGVIAGVDLDQHGTWGGFAVGRDGRSVTTNPDAVVGDACNFNELCAELGVNMKDSLAQRKLAQAAALATASNEATINALVANKGLGHAANPAAKSLRPIPAALVDSRMNPVSGVLFPQQARGHEKLALVLQAKCLACVALFDCDELWWCLQCNASRIFRFIADNRLFPRDAYEKGEFKLVPALKEIIVCLPKGQHMCDMHMCVKKHRGPANPPTGSRFLCIKKGCNNHVATHDDQITQSCHACGISYGGMDSDVPFEMEVSKSLGIVAEIKEKEELKYAYLVMVDGKKVLECEGQRVVKSVAQARLALNEVRAEPTSLSGPYTRLRSPISARKLAWLPTWTFDHEGKVGLWLWDFLPDVVKSLPSLSVDQLTNVVKLCEKGTVAGFTRPGTPVKVPAIGDASKCAEFITLCVTCFEIALDEMTLATSSAYAQDRHPSLELVRDLFQSQLHTQPPWVVFAMLNSFLEDVSTRVGKAATTPSADFLTFYERSHGNTVRFLFNPSNASTLRQVVTVNENKLALLGWQGTESQFDMGAAKPSPTPAPEGGGKSSKEKKKKEEKKNEEKKKEEKKKAEASKAEAKEESSPAPPPPRRLPGDRTWPQPTAYGGRGRGDRKGEKGERGGRGQGRGTKGGRGPQHSGSARDVSWRDTAQEEVAPVEEPPPEEQDYPDWWDTQEQEQEPDLEEQYEYYEEEEYPGSGRPSAPLPSSTRETSLPGAGAKFLRLKKGEIHGDGVPPLFNKLRASFPKTLVHKGENKPPQVCEVCCFFNSAQGCSHPACSREHVLLGAEHFTPAWHLWLLSLGGHHSFQGTIMEESICDLLSGDQVLQIMGISSPPARRDLLLRSLHNRLYSLIYANNEPLDTLPVTSGEVPIHRVALWGPNAPFPVASPSLVNPCNYDRVIVGCQDAVFQGLALDAGHQIGKWNNLCALTAVVSVMPRLHKAVTDSSGEGSKELMLRDCVISLLAQDWQNMNHKSSAAERMVNVAEALDPGGPNPYRGWLMDSLWTVLSPACLRNTHILQISVGREGRPTTYRLNVVNATISTSEGELRFNPRLATEQLKRSWSMGALHAQVVAVLVDEGHEGRHSEGFILGKGFSLQGVHAKLMQIAALGRSSSELVIYEERNAASRRKLSSDKRTPISQRQVSEARRAARRAGDALKVTDAEIEEHRESLDRELKSGRNLPPQGEPEENPELDERLLQPWLIAKEEPQPPPENFSVETHQQEWRAWHKRLNIKKELTGTPKWAKCYMQHYLPLLIEEEEAFKKNPTRALTFCSQFMNLWLLHEVDVHRHKPRKALEAMVAAVRKEAFGQRASRGPEWEAVHEAVKGSLGANHINLLKENILFGADPLFLDTLGGRGQWNKSLPADVKTTLKLLKDQFTEVAACRGLVFDHEAPRVKELLLKAGIRVSPIVTAVKHKPHGEPALDAEGDAQLRVCVNCSFGPDAPNKSMRSSEHTRQKTVAPESLVQMVLQEEKRYPNHEIRFVRDDLSAAFRQIALRLRRVGLFATTALNFVLVNLTLIFGAGPAPGDFEPLGDAILKAALAERRPLENWSKIGEQHPEVGRFVDDLFSIIAMSGHRCGDHLRRLRCMVVSIMGEGGINFEKQEEEGLPTNYKHAFGVVLDAVDRLVMAPWSKVVKLFNLSIDFVNQEVEGLTLSALESVRGVAYHVLFSCPGNGLARVVLPRIDAAIADAYRQFPGEKHPPGDCIPSSRLRGETEERGRQMFRRALNLLLRLCLINKGKLLRSPYEMVLAPEVRSTWPGKEGPGSKAEMLMDASGEALYLIDLTTGEFIQEAFSKAEQEVFNAYERGEKATTINHRELLSEYWGMVLLGPQHAGKLIELVNDNTGAENWTNRDRHRDAKVDQILSMIGLSETLLKQSVYGSRVKSEDNFADFGTRSDKELLYKEGIAALEKKYGWKAKQVKVPSWLRDVGWTLVSNQASEGDWYKHAITFVDWLDEKYPGLVESTSEVPSSTIRAALEAARMEEPISEVPTADGDFAPSARSEARAWATGTVPLTLNQLQRSLHKYVEEFGEEVGAQEFNLYQGFPSDLPPQVAIWAHLEESHQEVHNTFTTVNAKYSAEEQRAPPPPPRHLELPPECRMDKMVGAASTFTGTGAVDNSLKDTGWVRQNAFCDQAPHHMVNLAELHPEAEAVPKLEEFLHPEKKHSSELYTTSPPCPEHSEANIYRKGNADKFCGGYYQEQGQYIEHLESAIAHVECTKGVHESQPGRLSPVQSLLKSTPSYWASVVTVDAGKTRSPSTGRVAAVGHQRVHVFLWRKSCFEKKPNIQPNQAQALASYEDLLDGPREGKGYYAMPVEDQKSVTYFSGVPGKRGPNKGAQDHRAVRIGEVHDPDPGRGHHLFPNGIEDPFCGLCSVITGQGGSKWIPRVVNGRLHLTRVTNSEIARIYCADGRANIRPEWLETSSYKGQSAFGNMVPSNVADWVAHIMVVEGSKVQARSQATAFELWASEPGAYTEPQPELTSGGRKRAQVIEISPEEDAEIKQLIEDVTRSGKKAKTYANYDTHYGQWATLASAKGWDSSLTGLSVKEKCKRIVYWLAWERKTHNIKARTLRSKLSALRWKHISDWAPDPFEDTPGITDWLSNLEKLDGPTEFKLAVPITLLQMVICLLDPTLFKHASLKAALLTAFWFMLRSIEYLAEDDGVFDPNRSLTWGDVLARMMGHVLPLSKMADADELSITLYSTKNALETCTRTLKEVPGSETCVVAAMKELHAAFEREFGRPPRENEAVFKKSETEVYRRGDISQVLKLAAEAAGIPKGRFATHSLRRGGCSQYIAAGGQKNEAAIQRFGRWTSVAYKLYVMGASDALSQIQVAAVDLVPRFERN